MRHAYRAAFWLALVSLGGCGSDSSGSMNPVEWWHSLEGGRIADARPPPPNADAPYPTLATVPAKPPAPDAKQHASVTSTLVADRGLAEYTQKSQPLPVQPPPAGPPAEVKADVAKPADPDQMNATLETATAPPPAKAAATVPPAPAAAGGSPASSAVVASQPPTSQPPVTPPATPSDSQPGALPPTSGPTADVAMPDMPLAPPPPPQLAGVEGPPPVTAPTLLPPVPPPAAAPPPVPNGPPVAIPFAFGSAVLQADAMPTIKLLAKQQKAGFSIAVTGFGDGSSSDPQLQTEALPLGLNRARAVAAQLQANGVPATSIRIAAEAQGSGAAARLVN
jgi:outer membrane protein OmpA-like peptidoglycan-associated protein